jgi:predicted SnoaL-like aldol condensation-catalyzing enzyme
MRTRRGTIVHGLIGSAAALASFQASAAETACDTEAVAVGSALLDGYVAAVNAHDTRTFPELFTESYIQHSGRSPSGLVAQIELFKNLFTVTSNHHMQVEDRIIAGGKVVSRTTHTAIHSGTFRGFPPTGKPFSYRTIDIWRVENGKFAEHWDISEAEEVLRRLRSD